MTQNRWTTTKLGAFTAGALGSVVVGALLRRRPPGGRERWTRTSYAGRPVTLFEGPGYAVGAVAGALAGGAGRPAVLAGLGAAALGGLDDVVGDTSRRGLRGHLAAALRGEVTTGAIKVVGLAVIGVMTAQMVDTRMTRYPGERNSLIATLAGGAVIAGSANLANLLDLRPGRALKVVLMLAMPIVATGRGTQLSSAVASAAAGAAVSALPGDLAELSMLGDTGANSAGALLGTALVARTRVRGRLLALAVLTTLTLASEKVSFTSVIESTPVLREIDALGRPPWFRPGSSPAPSPAPSPTAFQQ